MVLVGAVVVHVVVVVVVVVTFIHGALQNNNSRRSAFGKVSLVPFNSAEATIEGSSIVSVRLTLLIALSLKAVLSVCPSVRPSHRPSVTPVSHADAVQAIKINFIPYYRALTGDGSSDMRGDLTGR